MMFYNLKNWLRRRHFSQRVQGLLHTAPIELGAAAAPVVLSQLQHKDVLMYLAGVKYFSPQVPPSTVHVVNDGSLTPEDRTLLARHVLGVQFHALEYCREQDLPIGGTWERPTAITHLSQTQYVIQFDAGTLTRGPIDEVTVAAQTNRTFTIGTWNGQTIKTARERAEKTRARNASLTHVQMLAEAHFDRLNEVATRKYACGCSGFVGFLAGSGKLELMHSLLFQMQQLIGTCRFRDGRYADMINSLEWRTIS
jgi:hypothetical protein